jgi:dTDP-glucose 4,6-dehydratase
MNKIAVVGGSGFVGSALLSRLDALGYDYHVYDLKNSLSLPRDRFTYVDITNRDQLVDLKLDERTILVNLAARQYADNVPRHRSERQSYFNAVNYEAATQLLLFALQRKVRRMIFLSTDMVYGIPVHFPITEDHPLNPIGEYGKSKLKLEQMISDVSKANHDLGISILRPRLISGPGRLGVFKKLFRLIKLGLPVPLIGDGSNSYQMVSVDDCATAILCCIDRDCPSMAFNLGGLPGLNVYETMRELIRHAGSHSVVVRTSSSTAKRVLSLFDKMDYPILYPDQFMIADADFLVDTSRAASYLGWYPTKSDLELLKLAYQHWTTL